MRLIWKIQNQNVKFKIEQQFVFIIKIFGKMSQQSQKQMVQFSIVAIIFVLILAVYVMLSYLIQLKNIKYLHESTVAILMGVLTGVVCKYALKTTISFSNQIFFAIILPPIIFSSGFTLRKITFYQNIGLISFFGIIGTIIGFVLITLVLVALDRIIFRSLNLTQLMIIASVLCATDTVASMTLIKPQRFPILNAVLFGQSIINDAVSIILFRAVSSSGMVSDQMLSGQTMIMMGLKFLYLFFFSLLLGIASGLFLSFLFRKFKFFSKHPIKETSIVLLMGYFTYLLGQLLSLSGIITLFTQSIIIGHYAFMNLSEQSKKGTGMAFETVSYMAQAFVYAYLGASVLSISQNWIAALMGLALIVFLPVVRAVIVYLLPGLYKICGKKFYLNPKQLKVCWFSGMIRGVITFALCLQIDSPNKQFITSLVLIVVMITSILGSSFMNKFVEIVKLQSSSSIEQRHLNQKTQGLNQHHESKQQNAEIQIIKQQMQQAGKKRSKIVQRLILFERKYMRPMFGKVQDSKLLQMQSVPQQSRMKQGESPYQLGRNLDINKIKYTKSQQTFQMRDVNNNQGLITKKEDQFNSWKPFGDKEN